jgi:putrescine transport system permease protein
MWPASKKSALKSKLRPLAALIAAPYAWLVVFFAAPFLIVLKLSLSRPADGRPPYTPVFDASAGINGLVSSVREFTLEPYLNLLADPLYLESYVSSLRVAAIATCAAFAIGYPIAYAMARAPRRWQAALLVLAIAPFWTSFLIRIYAWVMILKDEGLLNHLLLSAGLIAAPLKIYATETAVIIGIVYSYLPFMILPIYAALDRQDETLIEAAMDLGATRMRAFWTITAPLSWRGALAGCLLVFIPAVGEVVIPDLLGSSQVLMIGTTLWEEFFTARNWPGAAAVAVVLLLILIAPIAIYERMKMNPARAGGGL